MDPSSNPHSRKRKQCSSSYPVNGRFTRSKSLIHVHNSRSGRTWPDTQAWQPFEKPITFRRPLPENEGSLDLSIKDLRTRARRIFSPTGVVEEESRKFKLSEKGCNGVPKVVDNCEILELGIGESNIKLKNSYMDSNVGFSCYGKEEVRDREYVDSVTRDADSVLGLGSHGQPDEEEDLNLNQKSTVMEEKNAGHKVESGKDCRESQRNNSISGSKSVLNSFSKRKVFKAPSSFSYRRLLPFLMEMEKNDSSVPKIDVIKVAYPCKVQNLNNLDSNLSSSLTECNLNHTNDHSDQSKTLDEGDYLKSRIQLPVKGLNFDDPNKMAKSEDNVEISDMEQRNQENGNGVDELIEEFVQTTPPDDTILSKLDIGNAGASQECSAAQSGNLVLKKPSIGTNANNGGGISMKSQSARKNNSISNAKLALNPCSQLKIFKSPCFSYRRLLPFLTDVAKSTANIDEPAKFQREEGDSHSEVKESTEENSPIKRTRTDDILEYQDSEDQKPFERPVNPSNGGSSHDTIPVISTPFTSSADSLPTGKSNIASSKAIVKPNDMLLLQRPSRCELSTSGSPKKLELELCNNVIKSCHNENNCAGETSCSTAIHQELFTRESKPDASQVSELEPTDAAKGSMALGLDYHKDKRQLVGSVSPYQSSLEIEEFDHQRNQSHSPTKGILKRNPRGCRGLCHCLNCSSFRLHAERSFEFSKNQMLDAEEVADALIDELAELRNLLEKSVVFGDSDIVASQINQAREACKRALKTEQLAKCRLSLMNDDLKFHCRIRPLQRPRVTFSRYIEETAIPKTNLPVSTNLQKQDEEAK